MWSYADEGKSTIGNEHGITSVEPLTNKCKFRHNVDGSGHQREKKGKGGHSKVEIEKATIEFEKKLIFT
jgi:hypothetical protein